MKVFLTSRRGVHVSCHSCCVSFFEQEKTYPHPDPHAAFGDDLSVFLAVTGVSKTYLQEAPPDIPGNIPACGGPGGGMFFLAQVHDASPTPARSRTPLHFAGNSAGDLAGKPPSYVGPCSARSEMGGANPISGQTSPRNGFKNTRFRYVLGSGGPIFGFSVKNNAVWWY